MGVCRTSGIILTLALGWTGLASASLALATPLCETIGAGNAVCVETANGAVLAPSAEHAARIIAGMPDAEQRFALHFGAPPPRYVIAIGAENRARRAELQDAGFLVLQWLTHQERGAAAEATVRSGLEQRLRAMGMEQAQIDAQIERAVAQVSEQMSGGVAEINIIAHELGHLWLMRTFSERADDSDRYGSALPDWLDETAAVLVEDDATAQNRRLIFTTTRTESPDHILALRQFFENEHPLHQQARQVQAAQGVEANSGVRILSREEAERAGMDVSGGVAFYAQVRVFADYLIERAGSPHVFADIAAALSQGESMDAWLARRSGDWNLPGSVEAMERDWRRWIETDRG